MRTRDLGSSIELHPVTIEELLDATTQAIADPERVFVVPTNSLMQEIAEILCRLKHS